MILLHTLCQLCCCAPVRWAALIPTPPAEAPPLLTSISPLALRLVLRALVLYSRCGHRPRWDCRWGRVCADNRCPLCCASPLCPPSRSPLEQLWVQAEWALGGKNTRILEVGGPLKTHSFYIPSWAGGGTRPTGSPCFGCPIGHARAWGHVQGHHCPGCLEPGLRRFFLFSWEVNSSLQLFV